MTPNPDVVAAAVAAARKWGVPASVSIAQYAQESGWGAHMPPDSNNPFGIKAVDGQPSVTVRTQEFQGGRFVTINAAFRKFASLADAFDAHAQLLAQGAPYAHARSELTHFGIFAFCDALTGVYATDPNYGKELSALIVSENLQRYDG